MNEPATDAEPTQPTDDSRLIVFEQHGFAVRFGWGPNGLRRLAPHVDVVVIIDVLSFSTSVDIAVSRGVTVFPYAWNNGTAHDFADQVDALVAEKGAEHGWTLRPVTLVEAPADLRLVLPSPNGSALTFAARDAGAKKVIVGCLRNANAVASAIGTNETVAVIAAGERWRGGTGPLRPAIEDLLGAGAIISALGRSSISPEALIASSAFEGIEDRLGWVMRESGSGREHRDRIDAENIALAADLNCSNTVPGLDGDRLIPFTGS